MDFLSLDPLLRLSLREDIGRGDITTNSVLQALGPAEKRPARARVVAKEELVLAGWPVFLRVFELLGPVSGELFFQEGDEVDNEVVGQIHGEAALLLQGERVALNLLQRMCGVATQTRRLVELISHTDARILDTRKTTPLWRALEKYAVRVGGGVNHRMGLDDAVLIKENHIAIAGGIEAAIEACRKAVPHLRKIEVEVRNLGELQRAVAAGAEIVLLDNMAPEQVRQAVRAAAGRCLLEVSGGINAGNIVEYAETGVDFISLGLLTHSYRSSDISMLVEHE